MFHKMKLKPYLLSVFSCIIVLAAIVTIVGIVGLLNASSNTNNLTHVMRITNEISTVRVECNVAARNLREMLLTTNSATAKELETELNESMTRLDAAMEALKKDMGSSTQFTTYETAVNNWKEIAMEGVDDLNSGNREAATQLVLNECAPALREMANLATSLSETVAQEQTKIENATSVSLTAFIVAAVSVFVVALVFALYVSFKTTAMLTQAVARVRDAVLELSKGNLKTSIDYNAPNEFGELAERMNFSFQELAKYIDAIDFGMSSFAKGDFTVSCPLQFLGDFAQIQKSVENFQSKLNNTLVELDLSSAQVSAGSDQVADGAQALAQGATEQASSIEELSSAITEISGHINDTAEFSRKANELGKDAGETVQRGKDEMQQLLASIQDIAAASNNIQSIIKVIDDIAFQTNILALNAAVEAARAGNAGKGFAVVADEVRSLAAKSAAAAQETTQLINTSLQHVSRGEEIALRTDAAFNDVAESASNILEMIGKIAEASNEQASSIAQISVGIDQISAVVQTNSATSEQSAAASEELSGQAGIMKNLIAQFKLVRGNSMDFGSNDFSGSYSGGDYSSDKY